MDNDFFIKMLIVTGLILFIIFIIILIYLVIKIKNSLKDVTNTFIRFSKDSTIYFGNMSADITEMKQRLNASLDKFDENSKNLTVSLEKFENETLKAINFLEPFNLIANTIMKRISIPVLEATGIIAGASKAIIAFTNYLKNKKSKQSQTIA